MEIIEKNIIVKKIRGLKNFFKAIFLGEFETDNGLKIRTSNIPIYFACFESAKHQLPFNIRAYKEGSLFQVIGAW